MVMVQKKLMLNSKHFNWALIPRSDVKYTMSRKFREMM